MGDFLADTEPVGDPAVSGRYGCLLGDDWKALYVYGGATMGAALRAMCARLADPELRLLSVHALFLSPVPCGPLTIDTELLRAGRSVQQVAAVLRADASSHGELALRLQGTWGSHAADVITGLGEAMPSVAGPDDPSMLPPPPMPKELSDFQLHGQFEERYCPGWSRPGAFFDGAEAAESAVWARLRGGHRDGLGTFVPAVLLALADRAPGPHLGPTVQSGDREAGLRPMVTLELALRSIAEPVGDWLLLHGRIIEAAGGYLTTRVHMWDEARGLIAIADQLSRFAGGAKEAPHA